MSSKKDAQNVIDEIISSEKIYLENLELVIQVYLVPLRDAGIVETNEIQLQFGPWEMIYGIHKDLYGKLLQAKDKIFSEIENVFSQFLFLQIVLNNDANPKPRIIDIITLPVFV
jgi:hypothetical protein